MFNKNGNENPASKVIRNPNITNEDVLKLFDVYETSIGGIYKLLESKRNGLLELAKFHNRFEVVARFGQILDIKKDRESLKDILFYLACRYSDLETQPNSNKKISNYIDKVLGQLTSSFLSISDRAKLSDKEMAEVNVKVLLQRFQHPKARQKLYKEFLLDDSKLEELRELHKQLGYPTSLNPKKSKIRYANYNEEAFTATFAKGRILDGYEFSGFSTLICDEDARRLKTILKIIGNNSALTNEYFKKTQILVDLKGETYSRISYPEDYVSIVRAAIVNYNALAIEYMAQYIEDKDLLRSFFDPLEINFSSLFKSTYKEDRASVIQDVDEYIKQILTVLNKIIGDEATVQQIFLCKKISPLIMQQIIVPFLSQPRFYPYIKEAASVKDNLGCTHLDRAVAEGCNSLVLLLLKSGVTPTWFNFYRNECNEEVCCLLKTSYARSFFPTDWQPASYVEGIEDFARMHMNSRKREIVQNSQSENLLLIS